MIPIEEGFKLCVFQGLTNLEMSDIGKLKRKTVGLRLLLIKKQLVLIWLSKVSYIVICFVVEALPVSFLYEF